MNYKSSENTIETSETSLISVIIPNYNSGAYLLEAVQSVINQTYSNFEIIIIDNFSTDDSISNISSIKDNRIKIIQYSNGGIIAASRNRGAEASSGEWLAFLDADDVWMPRKLEFCMNKFSEGDLIFHDVRLLGQLTVKKQLLPNIRSANREIFSPEGMLERNNVIALSSVMIKKPLFEQISGFTEEKNLVGAEDLDLLIKAKTNGARFKRVDSVLGVYRVHSNNFSSKKSQYRKAAITLYRRQLNGNYHKNSFARAHLSLLLAYQAGSKRAACNLALFSLKKGRFSTKYRALRLIFQLLFK